MTTDIQLNVAIKKGESWRPRTSGIRLGFLVFLFTTLFLLFNHRQVFSLETIPVAAIFSKTGLAASHNAPLIKMTKLAVETINSRGGVMGQMVDLVVLDNNSTPIGAALAAQKAVNMGAVAVIGGHWSSHSLAMAPILQQAAVPMISPASTNPRVTSKGDYIFRVCFIDSFQGKAMALFARKELHAKRAAIVVNVDEAYSRTLAQYFEKNFTAAAGEVLKVIEYRGDAIDFSQIISQLKVLNLDVTYLPGYTRDSGLFIKQSQKMGFSTTFLGGDAWDEISKYAGTAVEGSYQTTAWHPTVPYDQSENLKKLYTDRYGCKLTNYSSPLAYDAVMVLKEAMETCRCTEGNKIRDALYGLQSYQGATGKITFNENGDPAGKDVIIIQFLKDKSVFVKALRP